MKGLNKAQVLGTIGNDLELKTTESGKSVLSFSMATNEAYTNEAGEKVETTDWHNIVVWGKPAEIIAEYMSKGSPILVEGKMRTRSWDKDDGTKGYKTEIIVRDFVFIPTGSGNSEAEPKASTTKTSNTKKTPTKRATPKQDEISVEDIPF